MPFTGSSDIISTRSCRLNTYYSNVSGSTLLPSFNGGLTQLIMLTRLSVVELVVFWWVQVASGHLQVSTNCWVSQSVWLTNFLATLVINFHLHTISMLLTSCLFQQTALSNHGQFKPDLCSVLYNGTLTLQKSTFGRCQARLGGVWAAFVNIILYYAKYHKCVAVSVNLYASVVPLPQCIANQWMDLKIQCYFQMLSR